MAAMLAADRSAVHAGKFIGVVNSGRTSRTEIDASVRPTLRQSFLPVKRA
jgi:hypothetical protein